MFSGFLLCFLFCFPQFRAFWNDVDFCISGPQYKYHYAWLSWHRVLLLTYKNNILDHLCLHASVLELLACEFVHNCKLTGVKIVSLKVKLTMLLFASITQLCRRDETWSEEAASEENLESVLARFFSNLQRIYKCANSYAHPHSHIDTNTGTHTQNEHTHTHTESYPTPLCSCVKWARVLSLGNTPLSQRRRERETHCGRGGRRERKKEVGGENKRERERKKGGERCHMVCMLMTVDLGFFCRSEDEPINLLSPYYTPLLTSASWHHILHTCTLSSNYHIKWVQAEVLLLREEHPIERAVSYCALQN